MGFRLISWLISILIVAKTTLCATPGALTENFCHEHEINRYVTHRFNLRLVVEEKNCASTGEMILAVYDAPESHISKAYFPAELKALKWIRGKCYIAIQGSNGPSFVERAVACAANLKLECEMKTWYAQWNPNSPPSLRASRDLLDNWIPSD